MAGPGDVPLRPPTGTGCLMKVAGATNVPGKANFLNPPRPEKPVETPVTTANISSMDAANPWATPTFASRTPLHIGAVGLIARDLDRQTNYYRDLLGLTVIERSRTLARLGVGGVT